MAIVELQEDLFQTIQVNGSVLSLQEYDSKLLCVDSTYSLSVFSKELSLEKNTQVSKDAEQPHRYSNAYSASPFGLVCVPIMGTKEGIVLRVGDEIATVGSIDEHEADVESSAFSPDGRYYATGGQDGRIFLYDTQHLSVIGSLIPRSDYISSLRFSHDSELLACAGYDKTVVVFDMVQNKTRCTIKTPDVVEKVAFCDNVQKLFMILRNGAAMLYDLVNRELLSTENLFATWPSALAISPDGRFAIVGVRGDSLYIVNALNNSKLMEIKINASGTNRLFFSKDWLFVGTIDGNILVVEYQRGQKELEEAVRKKDYQTARSMIENNVFLTIHPLMKVFDEDWPEILQKAIALLNAQKIEEAVELVQPFVYDQEKSREFDFYLGQQGAVRDFNKCVENKEYSKAYDMTLTVKFLVNTATFATLEQAWNRAFVQAKRLLEDNPSLNLRKAEAVLKPFDSGVKREIISKLIKNHQVFTQAEDLIKAKNFKGYFSLINQHSFLRDTDLYKKVYLLGERNMTEIFNLEQKGELEKAEEIARFLQIFPSFKRAATERIIILQQKRFLLAAIDGHDIAKAYAIVEEYRALRSMPQFKEFMKDFENVFEKAKDAALNGRPKTVMTIFGEYMNIAFWVDRIASLFKVAYIHEIENKIPEGNINWRVTLKRFIDRFGHDPMLEALMEQHKLQDELKAIEEEGSFIGYRTAKLVEEIVIFFVEKE